MVFATGLTPWCGGEPCVRPFAATKGEHVDTSALRTAGYVIATGFNGTKSSGYDRGVVEAAGKSFDIENRGQALDELVPPGQRARGPHFICPSNTLISIIDDYHDARNARAMPPNNFFHPALESVSGRYPAAAQTMLDAEVKKLEK